jgi:glycosyltransferase involved in cell wall biosynthesis
MTGGRGPAPVLLLSHSLGHGGSERQLVNFALALDRRRFAPHVASVLGGFHVDALRAAAVPVISIPLRSLYGPSALPAVNTLRAYVRQRGIRLVHAFDYTMSVFGAPAARTCRHVAILSSQRCYMQLVPSKYRYPLLLAHRLAHGVVVNCEEMRRHLSQDYSYPGDRIHVCYNGFDAERFSARGRAPKSSHERLVVGIVCVLRPEKNIQLLLEAFARVRGERDGLELLIVGSGPELPALRSRAAELGISDECKFSPSTPDAPGAMRAIDIFVHPSVSEGLPNAVMEAMACGCCVIATRVGGCPELIEDARTGLLFRSGDVDQLVAALRRAIADNALRAQIAAAGAAHIAAFAIDAVARRMEAIYDAFLHC